MRWSFSSLSAYDTCPMMFKLLYIDGLKEKGESNNAYAEFGTFCHGLLDAYSKGNLPEVALAEEYIAGFRDAIRHPFPPFPYGLYDKYYAAGLKYFSTFEGWGDDWDVLSSEDRFEIDVEGNKVVGIIDLVLINKKTHEIMVVDHKSKSKSSMNKELNIYRKQLYLYAMHIYEKWGAYPTVMRFNMFKDGYVIDETFNLDALEETKKWVVDTIAKIKADTDWKVSGSSYFCRWICSVMEDCPAKDAILMMG